MEQTTYSAALIEPGFWRIEDGGVRCFLIEGPDRAMLVDTGFGQGDLKAFIATLTPLPVFVVNTHADGDHTGCNAQFGSAAMHPAEFDRFTQSGRAQGVALRPLWEGDTITLGRRTFEVLLIPGHTPGSIALLDRANRLLISGDSVQTGTIYMFGPGRNLPAFLCSLEKLGSLAGAVDQILPSHGALPLAPAVIPRLHKAAQDLLAGKIPGTAPERDLPCLQYDCGVAGFYY